MKLAQYFAELQQDLTLARTEFNSAWRRCEKALKEAEGGDWVGLVVCASKLEEAGRAVVAAKEAVRVAEHAIRVAMVGAVRAHETED